MPWFRLDDKFHGNPKVMAAGNAAIGLYARCGTYCADHLTDGFIANAVARSYGSKREIASLLVIPHGSEHGLWSEVEGGYQMPDYLDFNPSREEVEVEQAKKHDGKVAAGKLGGIASGVARRKHSGSKAEANREAEPKRNEAPTRPDPTRPLRVQVSDDDDSQNTPASSSSALEHLVELLAEHYATTATITGTRTGWLKGTKANILAERRDELDQAITDGLTDDQAIRRLTGQPEPHARVPRLEADPRCPDCYGTGYVSTGINNTATHCPCRHDTGMATVHQLRGETA